jgi:hypothetical protein
MSEKLPVARCGDCLYYGALYGLHCNRFPNSVPQGPHDWCGEFVHRVLGKQYGSHAGLKLWRFPTEQEE